MAILSIKDAARMAGVSTDFMLSDISSGTISSSDGGIDVNELIRVYPSLKPLASLKIKQVKPASAVHDEQTSGPTVSPAQSPAQSNAEPEPSIKSTIEQAGTVELLVRELEWNKELLEQTNQLMAKQLADQRALIADQARRLDEKDRFWARQIEIAQSLLPAPAPAPVARKKFLGLF